MSFTVIIPARYSAQRLPGKPLLDICGKPMVQHTYERALDSNAKQVCIATDDSRIKEVVEDFGGKAFMPADTHLSGTDRIQEVTNILGLKDDELVVNVQADEPLIPSCVINQVANNLAEKIEAGISTLCEVISSRGEMEDPNIVKVVFNAKGRALYFSRSVIPHQSNAGISSCFRHIGIYAYRVKVLNQFVKLPPSELESIEKLEQLRALTNGIPMHVEMSSHQVPAGVDTQKDLETVRSILAG